MSCPISSCLVSKAALGDEASYQSLKQAMAVNLRYGHWTQFPCSCTPPCPTPSQEQTDALNKRLNEDLKGIKPDLSGPQGYPGIVGPPSESVVDNSHLL